MKTIKKWYERYNYDLMDQQFKEEIKQNPNFNVDDNIKELNSLKKNEMQKYWYPPYSYSHDKFLYYQRISRFWKQYKKEKGIRNNNAS